MKKRILLFTIGFIVCVAGLLGYCRITHDKIARAKIRRLISLVEKYENENGMFPDSIYKEKMEVPSDERILGIFPMPRPGYSSNSDNYTLSYRRLFFGWNSYKSKTGKWENNDAPETLLYLDSHKKTKKYVAPKKTVDGCSVVRQEHPQVALPRYFKPLVEKLCSISPDDCDVLKERTKVVSRRRRKSHGYLLVDTCLRGLLPLSLDLNRNEGMPLGQHGSMEEWKKKMERRPETQKNAADIEQSSSVLDAQTGRRSIVQIEERFTKLNASYPKGYPTKQVTMNVFAKCKSAYSSANRGELYDTVSSYLGAMNEMENYKKGEYPLSHSTFKTGVNMMKTIAKPTSYKSSGMHGNKLPGIPEKLLAERTIYTMPWRSVTSETVGVKIDTSWTVTAQNVLSFEKGIKSYLVDSGSDIAHKSDSYPRQYAGVTIGGQPMLYVRFHSPNTLHGCSGCRYRIDYPWDRLDSVFFNLLTGEYCELNRWW